MIEELKKEVIATRKKIMTVREIDKLVAEKVGVSISYLDKIRSINNERPKQETDYNIQLLENIKKQYEKWI